MAGTTGPEPASRRLPRLADVTSALLTASSMEEVATVVTDELTEAADAAIGSLSVVLDEDTLALVGIRGVREGVAEQWATYPTAGITPAAEAVRLRSPLLLVASRRSSAATPTSRWRPRATGRSCASR
jgi:hypothetical protein